MTFGKKINKRFVNIAVILLLLALWAAAWWKQDFQLCSGIQITFAEHMGENLVTESDVLRLIAPSQQETPVGKRVKDLDFMVLEKKIKANKLIKACHFSASFTGQLHIEIVQHQFLGRWVGDGLNTTDDKYLTDTGEWVPVSVNATQQLVILEGKFFQKKSTQINELMLEFLKLLAKDNFWRATITQIDVDASGNITLMTALSNHPIDFGKSIDVPVKLLKVKMIYKKILPTKGWDTYSKFCVKYRNQIIAEKI
jgi:cell division protein FtsQ